MNRMRPIHITVEFGGVFGRRLPDLRLHTKVPADWTDEEITHAIQEAAQERLVAAFEVEVDRQAYELIHGKNHQPDNPPVGIMGNWNEN